MSTPFPRREAKPRMSRPRSEPPQTGSLGRPKVKSFLGKRSRATRRSRWSIPPAVASILSGAARNRFPQAYGAPTFLARDGKTSAIIRSSLSDPPEIWAGPIGYWRQVTHRNAAVKPAWGEAKSIHWKSEGYDLQGWLLYPRDFVPAKKYPMVVEVHGGPGAAVQSKWPDSGHFAIALAGAGYFVFQPNPRGSFGQGEAFTRANVRDFGYGDFRDILAGVDEALRVAPIDSNR